MGLFLRGASETVEWPLRAVARWNKSLVDGSRDGGLEERGRGGKGEGRDGVVAC